MKIWVLLIKACGNYHVFTFGDPHRAKAFLATWARERLKQERPEAPIPDGDVGATQAWFEYELNDTWHLRVTTLDQA